MQFASKTKVIGSGKFMEHIYGLTPRRRIAAMIKMHLHVNQI